MTKLKCMFEDINNYEFIRKKMYFIIIIILFSILLTFVIVDGGLIVNLSIVIIMFIALSTTWFVGYFKYIYPMLRRIERDIYLEDKYYFIYDRFNKNE